MPSTNPRPGVDVVIPTYNAQRLVLGCVERLLHDHAVASVTVVDDASSDETVRALRDRFPGISLVELDAHRGLAHALNRGVDAGDADLILFLNNDVFPQNGAVARLAAALTADAEAVCAGGRLVDPGTGETQLAYQPRHVPNLLGLIARLIGIERLWPRNPWTGQHLREPLRESRRTDRQPAGACLMVRRSTLFAIGGWDERYWIWYEDVDIARRLTSLGPAVYVADAVFEHVGGASTGGWTKHEQHARLYHGTMVYAQTHLAPAQQMILGAVMLAVCLPRLLVYGRVTREAARVYRRLLVSAARMCTLRPVLPPEPALARPEAMCTCRS